MHVQCLVSDRRSAWRPADTGERSVIRGAGGSGWGLLSEQIDIMQLSRDEPGVVSEYSCGVTTKCLVIPHQDSF